MPPHQDRTGHTPDRHFRAASELYDPALAKAEREGRTISWVLRHALRLYVAGQLPLDEPGGDSRNGEDPSPGGG